MGFIDKIELKKQLKELGIKVQGNYVKRSDLEKICAANWAPTKKQREFATALETAYKANKNMAKDDVIKVAKDIGIAWNQIADMSDHEGYYSRDRLPMHFVRQIRNSHSNI